MVTTAEAVTTESVTSSTSRIALLRSAIEAIDEHGEAGVRVEEIGRRAGMSVAAIYHWFDSKRGLIEAAQRMRFDEVWDVTITAEVDRFRAQIAGASDPAQAKRRLLQFTGGLRNSSNDDSRMARLMLIGNSIHQPELRHLVTANYRAYLDTGAEALAQGVDRAGFRTDLDLRVSAAWMHNQALSRRVCELAATTIAPDRSDTFRDRAMSWALWATPLDGRPMASSTPAPLPPPAHNNEPDPSTPHGTEQLLVDRVVEHIDHHGEGSLRLRQITRELHFSETVIHRYFGGREGVIIRAQSERFDHSLGVNLEAFVDTVRACEDADEFMTVLRVMLRSRLSASKLAIRLRRLSALAAAHRRPALAELHGARLDVEAHAIATAIGHAQDRGWVLAELDAAGYAAWLNAVCTVHGCFEIDDMGLDLDAYRSVLIECAEQLLVTTPVQVG